MGSANILLRTAMRNTSVAMLNFSLLWHYLAKYFTHESNMHFVVFEVRKMVIVHQQGLNGNLYLPELNYILVSTHNVHVLLVSPNTRTVYNIQDRVQVLVQNV